MRAERLFTLPNLISGYRLATFPLILWLAATGRETLFAVLFCINLISDILDGLIARAFNQATRLGARLDSLADITLYILAAAGMAKFKRADLAPHAVPLLLAFACYLLPIAVAFLKFGKYPSLHLYSCKLGAYLQGLFFFILFTWGFRAWLFHAAVAWGILSWLEETAALLMQKEMVSDAKGLYWILKTRSGAQGGT